MASISQMVSDTRLRVDSPRPSKPEYRRVLLAVLDSVSNFYSRLSNTGQTWSVKPDYTLNVTGNQGDFLLALDDSYGKPIQVVSYYPSNPSYIQRLIDFRDFNDMYFDWSLPTNIASWAWTDGSNCTAMRMAFYNKDDGSRWVRVLPQPQLSAQYLITFASGDWMSTAGLDQSPVLTQFHSLVETWAAQSILPSCEWWEDQNLNQAHRRELAVALKNDEMRLADEFDRYIRSTVDDHLTIRDSMDNGMGSNYGGGWY